MDYILRWNLIWSVSSYFLSDVSNMSFDVNEIYKSSKEAVMVEW